MSTIYEIKRGVEMPAVKPAGGARKKALRLTLEAMEIGDMIEVPAAMSGIASGTMKNTAAATGAQYAKRPLGEQTIGIWRTA